MTHENDELSDWWQTSIIDMAPGHIAIRGTPIQDLIGQITFAQMVWLMTRGEVPSLEQAALLEAALVAAVDHGPQAPSIAAARMAATCGVGLNSVMATAVNMLGDVHGGAGEQCATLMYDIATRHSGAQSLEAAVSDGLAHWQSTQGRIIPGFGHRFHKPVDPRAPRLMELVRAAVQTGTVRGEFADIGEALQQKIGDARGEPIAMNIDGATAVIFCELGFPPPLCRGLFCLSRSIGAMAHGWEQMEQGGRNKGPMPPNVLPRYVPKADP